MRGAVAGVDFAVDEEWKIGAAAGFSSTDVDFVTPGDGADIDSIHMAAYAAYEAGSYYADALLSIGFHDVASTRLIHVGADVVSDSADTHAASVGLRASGSAIAFRKQKGRLQGRPTFVRLLLAIAGRLGRLVPG